MAVFSIADQSGTFPLTYARKFSTLQRHCRTLRVLSGIGAWERNNTGDTIKWNTRFDGQAAAAVNLDGGAFVTPASDVKVPCTLAQGSYSAPAQVTTRMQWTAGSSGGYGPDVNPWADQWNDAIMEALEAWCKLVNQHLYAGSGASDQMVGAATALAATGTYANINQATRATWASTVTGASGTLQTLTLARVKTLLRTVGDANPYGRPNLAFCRGPVFDTWEALFDAYAMLNHPLEAMPQISRESVIKTPAKIVLPGGEINSVGLRAMHWTTAGLWIIEDPDAIDTGATNANNTIFFWNAGDLCACYTPPPGQSEFHTDVKVIQAAEQMLGPLGTMPLEMSERPRTTFADTWDITGMLSIVFHTRNAHGKLQDQQ
jgi:hypothetical protein